ncbi:MAG: acyl--CoA ligase [Chrysiogenetes bacterium]|nr:acyl--CoA ligase [Chrysiogenetes bacterium]
MADQLDATTLANIEKAHRAAGKPDDLSDLPFPNIGALLKKRLAERPDEIFLHHANDTAGEEKTLTYRQFVAEVARATNFLHAHGVERGDTVATIAHNHWQTVVQYFACWFTGVRVMPLVAPDVKNTEEKYQRECLEDWSFKIDNAGAELALVRAEYYERARPLLNQCNGLREMIPVGAAVDGAPDEFTAICANLPEDLVIPDEPLATDPALIVYTSGTTGKPKGVDLSQCHLIYDAQGIAAWCGASSEEGGHRFMCVLPIHHVNGIVVTLVTPLFVGGSTLLNRAFKPDAFWARLESGKIQTVSVVPTLLHTLAEKAEDLAKRDLGALERIICGAGPLSVKLAREFTDTFDLRIAHGYGLSETTCYSCGLPGSMSDDLYEEVMHGWGFPSIGVPIEQNEMAILSPGTGEPVAASASPENIEKGEICIRGQNVMNGYFKRPDANADAFKGGWFHSGDEGFWIEREGKPYFFITGRIKELIIRGGVNISPYEVDEIIQALPGVAKALAVAVPSKHYSEEVGAYVQLEEGASLSAEQVLREGFEKLGFAKCPKFVFFAHEVGIDVPYTTTAKPQRILLQEKLSEAGRFEGLDEIQWRSADFQKEIGL